MIGSNRSIVMSENTILAVYFLLSVGTVIGNSSSISCVCCISF